MNAWKNFCLTCCCILIDILRFEFWKIRFHASGLKRAVLVMIEQLAERVGAKLAFVTGGAGIASAWLSSWHILIGVLQLALLLLSITSVLVGLYISYPKLKTEWLSRHSMSDEKKDDQQEDGQDG